MSLLVNPDFPKSEVASSLNSKGGNCGDKFYIYL